jgi:hypothetical protein
VIEDGATSHVIQTYLERERAKMDEPKTGEVVIRSVTLRGKDGERTRFEAGERAWLDVSFEALRKVEKVAVEVDLHDESMYMLFSTSSERLGTPAFDLEAGQSVTVTFELNMHLSNGTFHWAIYLYRYDIRREFDRALPAATFFVSTDVDVRGGANLYPRVADFRVS